VARNMSTMPLDRDCGSAGSPSVAWSRSPTLAPDGRVFFLTAPGSIGKLPLTAPNVLDEFERYLCSWDGHSADPGVTTLRGVADLAVLPDGRSLSQPSARPVPTVSRWLTPPPAARRSAGPSVRGVRRLEATAASQVD
jgi:hypothetical protein